MTQYETSVDRELEHWYRVMKERGHTPIMSSYNSEWLNIFVEDSGFHNGPGCSKCGWSCCMHCERSPEEAVPEKCGG